MIDHVVSFSAAGLDIEEAMIILVHAGLEGDQACLVDLLETALEACLGLVVAEE